MKRREKEEREDWRKFHYSALRFVTLRYAFTVDLISRGARTSNATRISALLMPLVPLRHRTAPHRSAPLCLQSTRLDWRLMLMRCLSDRLTLQQ